jgi:hypothetical protein
MRTIALQSAVGGMLLSIAGMFLAASGHLSPVGGAISHEVEDVVLVPAMFVVSAQGSAIPKVTFFLFTGHGSIRSQTAR